jgi:hypothetical protein
LALPLFSAFVLLFSFDLIAKINTPLPQVQAFWDNIKAQTITVKKDYNLLLNNDLQVTNDIESANKTNSEEDNFIFYWGSFQLKFQAANGNNNAFFSSIKISKTDIQNVVYHHDIPYFWNGKTLDDDFSFQLSYLDSAAMSAQTIRINRKEYLKSFQNNMSDQLFSFLKKVKNNDAVFISDLKTPSTGEKVLTGKIILTNDESDHIVRTFTNNQHQELSDFLDKKLVKKVDNKIITNNRMDFKWGEIGIMTKKVNKETLLNSILLQPILFNQNGQPIKEIALRLGHVPKIGGDAMMMDVKSDLIDYSVYNSKLSNIHKAMSCVKPKDMVYLDNITGTDQNGNTLMFSIVLEIVE